MLSVKKDLFIRKSQKLLSDLVVRMAANRTHCVHTAQWIQCGGVSAAIFVSPMSLLRPVMVLGSPLIPSVRVGGRKEGIAEKVEGLKIERGGGEEIVCYSNTNYCASSSGGWLLCVNDLFQFSFELFRVRGVWKQNKDA